MSEEVKDNNTQNNEQNDNKQIEMPPYPCALFEWTEDQNKYWKYTDDIENINKRASFKLWNTWLAWVDFHNDEKLIEIIAKKSEQDTDDFYLKQKIVNMIDRLGKVLSQTNLTEEILKLGF